MACPIPLHPDGNMGIVRDPPSILPLRYILQKDLCPVVAKIYVALMISILYWLHNITSSRQYTLYD